MFNEEIDLGQQAPGVIDIHYLARRCRNYWWKSGHFTPSGIFCVDIRWSDTTYRAKRLKQRKSFGKLVRRIRTWTGGKYQL
jgi:hypothetical protein